MQMSRQPSTSSHSHSHEEESHSPSGSSHSHSHSEHSHTEHASSSNHTHSTSHTEHSHSHSVHHVDEPDGHVHDAYHSHSHAHSHDHKHDDDVTSVAFTIEEDLDIEMVRHSIRILEQDGILNKTEGSSCVFSQLDATITILNYPNIADAVQLVK